MTIDPLSDSRWGALVARSPRSYPFHHPAWLRLISSVYGYEISAWVVADSQGELLAGLPVARVSSWLTGRRLVSLPFSDFCPPLFAGRADPDLTAALVAHIDADRLERQLDVEVRWAIPAGGSASPGSRFWHHVVPLQADVDAVQRQFSKSQIRRGINKARREGVTVRRTTAAAGLDAFYGLHLRTRRHQGVPTQPKRFIRAFQGLFEQGLGFVALAEWEDRPIAAAVFLSTGTTLLYKYGASERTHLDKRPNNLLFMEVIRDACERGATALDLGRTDLDNDGLRAFKLAWGAEERELSYTRLCAKPAAPRSGGVPAPLRRLIASSPPLVGRAVGEGLYRHYG